MSKNKNKLWEKWVGKLVKPIGGRYPTARKIKDIDNNTKHAPKGQR